MLHLSFTLVRRPVKENYTVLVPVLNYVILEVFGYQKTTILSYLKNSVEPM